MLSYVGKLSKEDSCDILGAKWTTTVNWGQTEHLSSQEDKKTKNATKELTGQVEHSGSMWLIDNFSIKYVSEGKACWRDPC